MINTIRVSTSFSFKGETYHPSTVVDLDKYANTDGTQDGLYLLLAKYNDIDTYSYLFEVMQAAEIIFSNPEGLAKKCLDDEGQLDLEKFRQLKKDTEVHQQLSAIALKILNIADLEKEPAMKQALMQAYKLGQQHSA